VSPVETDTIFITGTVGVGKTTVTGTLSVIEPATHAVIDLDEIRRLSPAPESDRFSHELELQNLRSMVVNFRRSGAERFILAGVIENRSEIARYTDALESSGMFVCRLVAREEVVVEKLERRHTHDPAGLAWHHKRAAELQRILEDAAVDNLVLDASEATAGELAVTIRRAAGWG